MTEAPNQEFDIAMEQLNTIHLKEIGSNNRPTDITISKDILENILDKDGNLLINESNVNEKLIEYSYFGNFIYVILLALIPAKKSEESAVKDNNKDDEERTELEQIRKDIIIEIYNNVIKNSTGGLDANRSVFDLKMFSDLNNKLIVLVNSDKELGIAINKFKLNNPKYAGILGKLSTKLAKLQAYALLQSFRQPATGKEPADLLGPLFEALDSKIEAVNKLLENSMKTDGTVIDEDTNKEKKAESSSMGRTYTGSILDSPSSRRSFADLQKPFNTSISSIASNASTVSNTTNVSQTELQTLYAKQRNRSIENIKNMVIPKLDLKLNDDIEAYLKELNTERLNSIGLSKDIIEQKLEKIKRIKEELGEIMKQDSELLTKIQNNPNYEITDDENTASIERNQKMNALFKELGDIQSELSTTKNKYTHYIDPYYSKYLKYKQKYLSLKNN